MFNLVIGSGPDCWRAHGRRPAPAADLVHRLGARWGAASAEAVAERLGTADPRTGRQQRASSSPPTPTSIWRCGHRVRRGGHGRSALHHHAPASSCTRTSPDELTRRLVDGLRAGSHRRSAGRRRTLMGPLVNADAPSTDDDGRARNSQAAGRRGAHRRQGAPGHRRPNFVEPTIVQHAGAVAAWSCEETFAPILYVMEYNAIWTKPSRCTTACRRGYRSAIFTTNLLTAERFLSRDGIGLRHRQRQHRHQRRGNRRRVWRREGDRRRPRSRLGRLESLHAAPDQHHQLVGRTAAGAGDRVWVGTKYAPRLGGSSYCTSFTHCRSCVSVRRM